MNIQLFLAFFQLITAITPPSLPSYPIGICAQVQAKTHIPHVVYIPYPDALNTSVKYAQGKISTTTITKLPRRTALNHVQTCMKMALESASCLGKDYRVVYNYIVDGSDFLNCTAIVMLNDAVSVNQYVVMNPKGVCLAFKKKKILTLYSTDLIPLFWPPDEFTPRTSMYVDKYPSVFKYVVGNNSVVVDVVPGMFNFFVVDRAEAAIYCLSRLFKECDRVPIDYRKDFTFSVSVVKPFRCKCTGKVSIKS